MTDQRPEIAWLPVDYGEGYAAPFFPLTTFGTAVHGTFGPDGAARGGVVIPEVPGAAIDPEIAPLVAALNRAGVPTVQSCQDIADVAAQVSEGWLPEDTPRMGAVVVAWETFPLVAKVLPECARSMVHNDTGWLFAADADAGHVTILFPWRDVAAFVAAAGG